MGLKCGVCSHWDITKSSSKRVGNIVFTQPQSAKEASKAIVEVQASADKTKSNNASSFDNKPSPTFQLVVVSVNWKSKAISNKPFIFQFFVGSKRAKCLNSQESSCAFQLVACAKPLLKSNKAHTITPSLCLKFTVESISKRAWFAPTTFKAFKLLLLWLLSPTSVDCWTFNRVKLFNCWLPKGCQVNSDFDFWGSTCSANHLLLSFWGSAVTFKRWRYWNERH